MKIVILNYNCSCVDIVYVSEEDKEKYGGEHFDDIQCLHDYGYSENEIHWMCVDDDPDEVPVYWAGENIPVICL